MVNKSEQEVLNELEMAARARGFVSNVALEEVINTKGVSASKDDSDDWLLTYSDMVTILLTFFVLLLSVTDVKQAKFEALNQSLNEGMLRKEALVNPLKDLESALSTVLTQYDVDPKKSLQLNDNSLKVDLPEKLLFATASTDLSDESVAMISAIAQQIKAFPLPQYQVEIEGHTDDIPINTPRFPSNWELSSARAIRVLQIFFDVGIDNYRLKAVGYADSRPKVANKDDLGKAISENQSQNRRVEIVVVAN